MNDGFVCIKVDREERPDIDAIYMEAVQAISGHGGWPMTVFMTRRRQAVLRRHLLPEAAAPAPCWLRSPTRGETDAPSSSSRPGRSRSHSSRMSKLATAEGQALPGTDVLNAALQQIGSQFDPEWGGFGRGAEVPSGDDARAVLARPRAQRRRRCSHRRDDLARCDGVGRHVRPPRRAGSPATRSTRSGWCRTSRRCSTTRRCSPACTSTPGSSSARSAGGRCSTRRSPTCSATCDSPRAASPRPRTPTPRARRVASTSGAIEDIEAVLGPDLAPAAIEWYGVTKAGNFEGSNILHRPVRGDLVRPAARSSRRARSCSTRVSNACGPASTTRC